MAHHEDYLDGRQADQHGLIAVLSERFDWSKIATIKTLLTRLVEKGCLPEKNLAKPLSTRLVEAGPEFRLGG